MYKHFSAMQCPYCSLTCDVEVTQARAFMLAHGIPSYAGMIYLVTKAVHSVPELRVRIVGEDVFEYDLVHPSFTLLNSNNQLCFGAARYDADPNVFLRRTREAMERAKNAQQLDLGPAGQDVLYLSCVPWVHFTSVSHPMRLGQPDSIPRITWGRFEPKDGKSEKDGKREKVAVNLQVHHGLADGLHISQFMLALEALCADPHTAFAGLAPEMLTEGILPDETLAPETLA